MKIVNKTSKLSTYKSMAKDELSDYAKYINVINKDSTGKNITPMVVLRLIQILNMEDITF